MKVMALKVIKYAHTQTHMQRMSMSLCKCDSVRLRMQSSASKKCREETEREGNCAALPEEAQTKNTILGIH
jgi:hypothetical protein